ncbi:MAG: AAA family ATPase [Verrucomicrobiia bacterium]
MKIVTFYSFRGGVGRSLSVANVGHNLVETRERRVLLVDFDLEAPGLSFMPFLSPEKKAKSGGIFEFMLAFQKGRNPDIANYVSPLREYQNHLFLMKSGNMQKGYSVGELNVKRLLKSTRQRPNFAQYFRKQAESLGYHYVLLDSRTGLTEIGGMCTVALADLVVILTGLNRQNLEGTKWVLRNIQARGADPNRSLVVFSHVPDSEEELKRRRMREALNDLGLKGGQASTSLSYHPRVSLEEELFVKDWPETRLAESYVRLAKEICSRNDEDIDKLTARIRGAEYGPPRKTEETLRQVAETADSLYPESPTLHRALGVVYFARKLDIDAQRHLSLYLRKSPGLHPVEQSLLLTCLYRQNKVGELEAEFRRAVDLARKSDAGVRSEMVERLAILDRAYIQSRPKARRKVAVWLRGEAEMLKLMLRTKQSNERMARLLDGLSGTEVYLHYVDPNTRYLDAALEHARESLRLGNESATYNLACAYALKGQRVEALRELQRTPPRTLITVAPDKDRDWEMYWSDPEFRKILRTAKRDALPRRRR